MPDDIGSYQVFQAGAAIRFWPLVSGTTLANAAPAPPAHPVKPGKPNTIVIANFGLVDVAIPLPPDAPITRTKVAAAKLGLPARVAGRGVDRAELFADQSGNPNLAQLTFAVDAGHATRAYDCELRVTIDTAAGARRMDVLLQVRPGQQENGLFVVPALTKATHSYTWAWVQAVSQARAATKVANAKGLLRILRDNVTVKDFNREFEVTTNKAGLVMLKAAGLAGGTQERTAVGVPLELPLICDLTAAKFERRAHMFEWKPAKRAGHHNNNPNAPGNVTLIPSTNASLATNRFVLDPGHGVAYADTAGRCYEWFVAHRTAHHIAHLLKTRHKVPAANITFMRTAGLGLIDPTSFVAANPAAPEFEPAANKPLGVKALKDGETWFKYDMTARTLRTKVATRTLKHVSDMLFATHETKLPYGMNPIPNAERKKILDENPATISACIARAAKRLPKRTAMAGSERWDATTQKYVFDTHPAGKSKGALQTHDIAINTSDVFAVSNASLRRLAERTARWSLLREATSMKFHQDHARPAMLKHNALQYMADACFSEADRPKGDPFLKHGLRGWGFSERRKDMAAMSPVPDITLTLHHNAVGSGDAQGIMLIVAKPAIATEAHLRLQKTYLKYVTALNQGLHHKGMNDNHAVSPKDPSFSSVVNGYAFFECEFMNAPIAVGPGASGPPYDYDRMVTDAFVQHLAEEIVAAVVEFLVHPQPDAELDPVDINAKIKAGTVLW
jgi:hypothetical protein